MNSYCPQKKLLNVLKYVHYTDLCLNPSAYGKWAEGSIENKAADRTKV